MTQPDEMVTTTCPTLTCGVPFAIPRHVYAQAQRFGQERKVYCPNGHWVVWKVTDAERLQKRVDELQAQVEGIRSITCSQEEEIDKLHRSVRYWRGWATHWKKRATKARP